MPLFIYRHALLICLLLVTGCAPIVVAPTYQPNATTTLLLQENKAGKVDVGLFNSSMDDLANPRRLFNNHTFISPYNDSFADYIATALRMELGQAGCFNQQAPIVVSGTLLANSLNISPSFWGFDDAWEAGMTVDFVIRSNNRTIFNKRVTKSHKWEYTHVGGIPKAIQEYGTMVQLLVRDLVGDPEFIAATKRNSSVAPESR